jgi:lipid-binding SYLF domain-containing protein
MSISTRRAGVLLLVAIAVLTGCVSPQGDTVAEKRSAAQEMRADVLETFYSAMPQMRDELADAPGYGTFSGLGTQTLLMSTGQGWGIIHDNDSGKDTYMSAIKLGGGLGVGVSEVRAVVVFHDPKTMHDVIEHGWGVTAKGDAAAKVGDSGAAGAMVITLPGMSIYRFTKNGAMLGGAIEGTKIWKDESLN